jgi:hypothetical protein
MQDELRAPAYSDPAATSSVPSTLPTGLCSSASRFALLAVLITTALLSRLDPARPVETCLTPAWPPLAPKPLHRPSSLLAAPTFFTSVQTRDGPPTPSLHAPLRLTVNAGWGATTVTLVLLGPAHCWPSAALPTNSSVGFVFFQSPSSLTPALRHSLDPSRHDRPPCTPSFDLSSHGCSTHCTETLTAP